MTSIRTIANNLNKTDEYVEGLCKSKNLIIEYDQDGAYISDEAAQQLLQQELEMPTRYNFRGVPCTDIQRHMLGDAGLQMFWLGNVLKYLYRSQSIGDLLKAKTYLQFIIDDAKEKGLKY